jgi:hypothetical protein
LFGRMLVAPSEFGKIDEVVARSTVDLEPRSIDVWTDKLVVDKGPTSTTLEGWDGLEAISAVAGSLSVAVLMGTETGGEIREILEIRLHVFEVLCVDGADGLIELIDTVNRHRRWSYIANVNIAVASSQVDHR